MKNSLKALLGVLVGGISLLGMEVSAVDSTIKVDLTNPVQHVGSVKFIQQGASGSVVLHKVGSSLLRAETSSGMNIILNKNEDVDPNTKDSVILGGENNHLKGGELSTIIAGIENVIEGGTGNTILGGEGNKIEGGERFSTIIGGRMNYIKGRLSTILGGNDNKIIGNNSAIVGMNNSVEGNNSVAMGINSYVKGDNSFLWTDEENRDILEASNVFAVVSEKGMVINSDNSNDNVKLTVGGSLVINMNNKDKNVKCEGGQGAGTLKTVSTGGHYCLCSCDGQEWNSMFGEGFCQSACDGDIQPVCGSGYRIYENHHYYFTGTCLKGYAVGGTGAYLIDKNNVLHWTCQTTNGTAVGCSTDSISTSSQYGTCELSGQILSGDITNPGTIRAYQDSTPAGECVSELRTCRDGILDGSYQYLSCTPGCKKPWSSEYIKNGASITGYKQNGVEFGGNCEFKVLTCGDSNYDELSKEYKYSSCNQSDPKACVYKGKSYKHGDPLVTYSRDKEECPKVCERADFTCNNEDWLNEKGEVVELNQDPEPGQGGGLTIAVDPFGNPVPAEPAEPAIAGLGAYLDCEQLNSSSESEFTLTSCPEGGICSSGEVYFANKEDKTCNAPITKYKLNSCNVGYALDSENNRCVRYCTLDGWMFGPGESYLAYQSENVPSGSNCVSETRTCQDNGTFSGSYQYLECHVGCSFNGSGYNHGQEVQGYLSATATCPSTCTTTGVVCQDGNWSASVHVGCTQQDSTNYSSYTLTSCPTHGICSNETVYKANNSNKTCSSSTKFKLNSCESGWKKSGDVCIEDTSSRCYFNGSYYDNGDPAQGYSSTSATCPTECSTRQVTCQNGSWSQTIYADCTQNSAGNTTYYNHDSCPTSSTYCSSETVYVANNTNKTCSSSTRYHYDGCKSGYQWNSSYTACEWKPVGGGGGGGSVCFLAGTPVLTPDGSKNIEDIEEGDLVLSYNSVTNEKEYNKVLWHIVHENSTDDVYELTIDGKVLEATEWHPFYVIGSTNTSYQCKLPYRLVHAKDLKVGDQLFMSNGDYATIENVAHRSNFGVTYNLTVENAHNYFVGEGYLVHNAAPIGGNTSIGFGDGGGDVGGVNLIDLRIWGDGTRTNNGNGFSPSGTTSWCPLPPCA